MNVRERILTIRLMEKLKANPAQAEALGIVAKICTAEKRKLNASGSAANKS